MAVVTRPAKQHYYDDDQDLGLLFDIHEGRMRRHIGRQIGFLADWEGDAMPKVGDKKFPYTPAGKKAAAKARKQMGAKGYSKKLKGAR